MPDITIAGATFRSVPQIDVPKDGGGSASFVYEEGTKQITENGTHNVSGFVSAEVNVSGGGSATIEPLSVTQNGTYTAPSGVDGYSPVTVNVPSGATNVVVKNFGTGSSAGTHTETIPYTGDGYLKALMIYYYKGAYNQTGGSTWYNLIQRYAVGQWTMHKSEQDTVPSYESGSASNNWGVVTCIYKNSTSSATNYTRISEMDVNVYTSSNPTSEAHNIVKVIGQKKFAVRVASSNYALPLNMTYTYIAVFSD